MTQPDLLPCPFCGGQAEFEQLGDHSRSTICRCTSCSCSLETGEEWGHGRRWNERAAIASGDLVPASAVAAERERCAKWAEGLKWKPSPSTPKQNAELIGKITKDWGAKIAANIRSLSPEPASGEFVVVPRVPTEAMLNAGDMAFCDSYGPSRVERGERIWPVGRLNIAAAWTAMLNAATKDGERA